MHSLRTCSIRNAVGAGLLAVIVIDLQDRSITCRIRSQDLLHIVIFRRNIHYNIMIIILRIAVGSTCFLILILRLIPGILRSILRLADGDVIHGNRLVHCETDLPCGLITCKIHSRICDHVISIRRILIGAVLLILPYRRGGLGSIVGHQFFRDRQTMDSILIVIRNGHADVCRLTKITIALFIIRSIAKGCCDGRICGIDHKLRYYSCICIRCVIHCLKPDRTNGLPFNHKTRVLYSACRILPAYFLLDGVIGHL